MREYFAEEGRRGVCTIRPEDGETLANSGSNIEPSVKDGRACTVSIGVKT